MQLTVVSVAIHDRDEQPDSDGAIVMTLRSAPGGFLFDLTEVGSEQGVMLTEEELAALPAARALLLDQFARQS